MRLFLRLPLSAVSPAIALALALGATASFADTVTTWMEVAEHAVSEADGATSVKRTPGTSRVTAQVALAVFTATNSIELRYESYLELPAPAAGASAEAAAAAAAHAVLVAIYPDQQKTFDDALLISLAGVPDGDAEKAGVEQGKLAAAAAMKRSALPADAVLDPYRPLTEPGVYIDPGLPSILPFDTALPPYFLTRIDELRPTGPPALASPRYARDLEEVRRLGAKDSQERPADKGLLARPWLWINYQPMIADIARRPGRSLTQNARLYALTNMAIEDAWSAIMEAKMHFARWRPITAIRNADRDGNDATTRDPAWEPLLKTPTHSDYPCGHCGVSAAFATVMESETGAAPAGGIRLSSWDDNPGFQVVLPTWKAFVDEMSMSRIYSGAHTRSANEDAEAMGRTAARKALMAMRPLAP